MEPFSRAAGHDLKHQKSGGTWQPRACAKPVAHQVTAEFCITGTRKARLERAKRVRRNPRRGPGPGPGSVPVTNCRLQQAANVVGAAHEMGYFI